MLISAPLIAVPTNAFEHYKVPPTTAQQSYLKSSGVRPGCESRGLCVLTIVGVTSSTGDASVQFNEVEITAAPRHPRGSGSVTK